MPVPFLLNDSPLVLPVVPAAEAPSGEFFFAPRGVPHAYRVGEMGASCVVISSAAGFERFVLAAAALGEEPTPEQLGAIAASCEIELLGPPGSLP